MFFIQIPYWKLKINEQLRICKQNIGIFKTHRLPKQLKSCFEVSLKKTNSKLNSY